LVPLKFQKEVKEMIPMDRFEEKGDKRVEYYLKEISEFESRKALILVSPAVDLANILSLPMIPFV
jgi:hypothetical protein